MPGWKPRCVGAFAVVLSVAAFARVGVSSQRGGRQPSVRGDADWFCIDGVGRGRAGRDNQSPLNETAALRVTIDDPDRLLPATALEKVAGHFMSALTVWRRACQACDGGSLIHISVNGQSFLNGAAATAIRSATPTTQWVRGRPVPGTSVAGREAIYLDFVETQMRSTLNPRGIPPAPMVPVAKHDALFTHLCSLPATNLPGFVTRLQRDLFCATGGDDRGVDSGRPLRIVVRNQHTSCGFSRNIIACETDPFLLEFNARDYAFTDGAFTDGTRGDRLFGNGTTAVPLDHVLVHELGHWVGLPHVASTGSIMADALQDSKCVDAATVEALRDVTGKPWTPTEKASLKYARDGTGRHQLPWVDRWW
jgi:hypothetical protein